MSQKLEFVKRAEQEGVSEALCSAFNISRQLGYTLLRRYLAEGVDGLEDRSRRPHSSPGATPQPIIDVILELRQEHPYWGPRKLRRVLLNTGKLRDDNAPAISTVAAILQRNDCIDPDATRAHQPIQRFERASCNELWQMDFKGPVMMTNGKYCYPLTVTDDCSRFNIALVSCADMQGTTVKAALTKAFREHGLPDKMLTDNGSPWGSFDTQSRHTPLSVWMMHVGVGMTHGRPYHPQTQGKAERFHGTLKRELLSRVTLTSHRQSQHEFDRYRVRYNDIRPHEAIGDAVPSSRHQVSQRPFPNRLPSITYPIDAIVRKVQDKGKISLHGQSVHIGRGFIGYPIGLLPSEIDGILDVYFCQFKISTIDLRAKIITSDLQP